MTVIHMAYINVYEREDKYYYICQFEWYRGVNSSQVYFTWDFFIVRGNSSEFSIQEKAVYASDAHKCKWKMSLRDCIRRDKAAKSLMIEG